jgi:hypothetical protein
MKRGGWRLSHPPGVYPPAGKANKIGLVEMQVLQGFLGTGRHRQAEQDANTSTKSVENPWTKTRFVPRLSACQRRDRHMDLTQIVSVEL